MSVKEFVEKYSGKWVLYEGISMGFTLQGPSLKDKRLNYKTWLLVKGAGTANNCIRVWAESIGEFDLYLYHFPNLSNITARATFSAPKPHPISRPNAPWRL